ncbi:hypothetical protein JCM11754A_25720 [Isoptericola variabilis]
MGDAVPDSREWASIIIVVAIVGVGLAVPGVRNAFRGQTWRRVIVTALHPRLAVLWLTYLVYATAVFIGASEIGWWEPSMTWTSILLVMFGGIPLVTKFVSLRTSRDVHPVRDVVRDTFGLAAILGAYAYLLPMPLGWEIVIQLALLVFGIAAAVDARAQRPFLLVVVLVLVVGFLRTTELLSGGMAADGWLELARVCALPFWYPIALLPLLWGTGYYAAVEAAACHVAVSRHPQRSKRRWMVTLAVGLRLRLARARDFVHPWPGLLADTRTRAERREVLAAYRRSTARRPSQTLVFGKIADQTRGA